MYFTYDFCLFSPLWITVAAAIGLFILAFTPKFSVAILGNSICLLTVFAPLAINRLTLGTQVGLGLVSANFLFLVFLLFRWSINANLQKAWLPVLISLIGLTGFGMHVFVFAATP